MIYISEGLTLGNRSKFFLCPSQDKKSHSASHQLFRLTTLQQNQNSNLI